jgi:hypothetical protein
MNKNSVIGAQTCRCLRLLNTTIGRNDQFSVDTENVHALAFLDAVDDHPVLIGQQGDVVQLLAEALDLRDDVGDEGSHVSMKLDDSQHSGNNQNEGHCAGSPGSRFQSSPFGPDAGLLESFDQRILEM